MPGKESWDSSDRKAVELKISDFGTLDEVREMAKPVRTAKNREEATKALKDIAQKGKLASKSGVIASLSGKSVDKIMSGQASQQSFSQKAHWQAAANVDKLFQNTLEPWAFELDPGKNNENLKDRRYLYAPMDYEGVILPVKFTVKEYKQQGIGERIYSLEVIAVKMK
jgi:K+-sensing histidine kinase KdpD